MIIWWKQVDDFAYVRTEADVRNSEFPRGCRAVLCDGETKVIVRRKGKWCLDPISPGKPIELTQTDDLDLAIALINMLYKAE